MPARAARGGVLAGGAEDRAPEFVVVLVGRQVLGQLIHHRGRVGVLLGLVVHRDDAYAAFGMHPHLRLVICAAHVVLSLG